MAEVAERCYPGARFRLDRAEARPVAPESAHPTKMGGPHMALVEPDAEKEAILVAHERTYHAF